MKKQSSLQRVKIIVSVIFIVSGIVVGSVPVIAPILTQKHQNAVIERYRQEVSNMSREELDKAKSEAKEYNASTDDDKKGNYYAAISTETVISFIEIPSINVHLPVYKGTAEKTLERGIGWLEKTSFPIGGDGTHCVLSGHSGLVTQTMFSNLSRMKSGDKFYLNTYDEVLCYKVYNIITLEPDEVNDYIKFEKDHDYCTLITCTPIGINTHRLLVMGERYNDEEEAEETADTTTNSYIAHFQTSDDIKEEPETVENIVSRKNEQHNSTAFFQSEYIICIIISIVLELTGLIIFIRTLREVKKAE